MTKKIATGDHALIKKINKSIVLKSIENKGPLSRAQISKETGLNKATVSTMASELIKDSFIYEIGSGKSSGGRKPVLLYYNNNAGYSIGIDLGVNYILALLVDLSGNIVEEVNHPLNTNNLKEVTNKLISIINTLIDKSPDSPYGVIGIGVGVPGMVDNRGTILLAPNLQWKQIDLKLLLEDHFEIPVCIENEANAGSISELFYGAGKNISNLINVSVGIGIGTGIILNGKLYTGSAGISGEIGHMTVESQGKKCRCGNRGCWELYASESVLLEEAKKVPVFSKKQDLSIDEIIIEARKGNDQVIQLLNNIGEFIGIGLVNIINTFNPEKVIIGNRIARFEDWLTNPINHILEERLSTYHYNKTKIDFSSLGIYSSALGASSLPISDFLQNIGK